MKAYQRRKRPIQAAHADDWLMTYADMITLLLCFFAIFLSVTVPQKVPGAVLQKQKPVENFKKPDIFEGKLPFHGLDIAEEETAAEPMAPPPPPPVKLEQKGDRITVIEMNSAAFFDSGSATLSDGGKSILSGVASSLSGDQYKDYIATVEGHTDDTPINTAQFPSNWELSTARAASVVRYLIEQGVPAYRLRAAGYADTYPKAPNHDVSGTKIPENQAKNRRVAIKLEKIEKQ